MYFVPSFFCASTPTIRPSLTISRSAFGVGVDLDAEIPHGLFHLPVGQAAAALEVERAVELEFGAVLQFWSMNSGLKRLIAQSAARGRVLREHRERCQVVLQVAIADQIVDQSLRRIEGDAFFLLELRAHDGPLPAADGRCAAGNAHLSRTVTRAPCSAALTAAASPENPDPMMTTSSAASTVFPACFGAVLRAG